LLITIMKHLRASTARQPSGKRPIGHRAAGIQGFGHVLARFGFVDEPPGTADLIGGATAQERAQGTLSEKKSATR
jgi:hypothetical protein